MSGPALVVYEEALYRAIVAEVLDYFSWGTDQPPPESDADFIAGRVLRRLVAEIEDPT